MCHGLFVPWPSGFVHKSNTYRHELKYCISFADYLALSRPTVPVMKPIVTQAPDGRYLIRSVYFDNFNDKALRENAVACKNGEVSYSLV